MKNIKKILVLLVIIILTACSASSNKTVMMATTTSLNDSKLLDVLAPAFKKDTGIELKWQSVGSGEAIKLARDGQAELLFAHSPADEKKLVDDGVSNGATEVMFNNFLLVGPKELKQKKLADVTKEICNSEPYISRGDDSGTHKKEIKLFEEYCGGKKPKNYQEAGAGMLDTLNMASEKQANTLSDIATWLENKDKLKLKEVFYDKGELVNTYSIHTIKHKNLSDEQTKNAEEFKKWVTSEKALNIIKDYGKDKFKTPVFTLVDGK